MVFGRGGPVPILDAARGGGHDARGRGCLVSSDPLIAQDLLPSIPLTRVRALSFSHTQTHTLILILSLSPTLFRYLPRNTSHTYSRTNPTLTAGTQGGHAGS